MPTNHRAKVLQVDGAAKRHAQTLATGAWGGPPHIGCPFEKWANMWET